MVSLNEQKLIELAQKGDQSAFEQLLDRYQKPIFHHALRLVGNPEDAADVTQEVFIKVWRNLSSFRGESEFSTWLYRLTDNAAIDLIRREKKRRDDSSLNDEESTAVLPVDPAPTPHQAAEQKELQQALADGLAQLSEEHRRVLVMREIGGLSYEEIGNILNLSAGTVKSRIARARISLAKFLQKTGNFFE